MLTRAMEQCRQHGPDGVEAVALVVVSRGPEGLMTEVNVTGRRLAGLIGTLDLSRQIIENEFIPQLWEAAKGVSHVPTEREAAIQFLEMMALHAHSGLQVGMAVLDMLHEIEEGS